MKPGVTARPRASRSMTPRPAIVPTSTIRAPRTPTSATRAGAPVPSYTVPPRITTSCVPAVAMVVSIVGSALAGVCPRSLSRAVPGEGSSALDLTDRRGGHALPGPALARIAPAGRAVPPGRLLRQVERHAPLDDLQDARRRDPDDPGDLGHRAGDEIEQLLVRPEHRSHQDVVAAGGDPDEVDLRRPGQPLGDRAHPGQLDLHMKLRPD